MEEYRHTNGWICPLTINRAIGIESEHNQSTIRTTLEKSKKSEQTTRENTLTQTHPIPSQFAGSHRPRIVKVMGLC